MPPPNLALGSESSWEAADGELTFVQRPAHVRTLFLFGHPPGVQALARRGARAIFSRRSMRTRSCWQATSSMRLSLQSEVLLVDGALARGAACCWPSVVPGRASIYIPGNHDAALAPFVAMLDGQLEVHREWVHLTARGERMLVVHGDQFDGAAADRRLAAPRWRGASTT